METLSFEMLPGVVAELVKEIRALKVAIEKKEERNEDEPMTVQQAAAFLSLTVPTIYGLINKRQIPCMKRGKRVYFSRKALLEYLQVGRKKIAEDYAAEANNFLKNKKRQKC